MRACAAFLAGSAWADVSSWVNLLLAYDVLFLAVPLMVFDFVVEE